jgi:hypothetical protein
MSRRRCLIRRHITEYLEMCNTFEYCSRIGWWKMNYVIDSDIAEFLTVSRAPQKAWCSFRRDLIWNSNQKAHINSRIFLDDIRIVFFPYLVRLRDLAEFEQ